MKVLAAVVAVFALAAFAVGLHAPDTMLFLLAAAALGSAATTLLARRLSTFLKIFEIIFAVETVVFGLAFLAQRLGFVAEGLCRLRVAGQPAADGRAFRDFRVRDFLRPVIRKMTDIADPYFEETTPTSARVWPLPRFIVPNNAISRPPRWFSWS